ncbi:hypothetical protein [Exiguobacterium profundum]|uniref:hypothetical protein n=1 Tax=Exiguobacterium profundum TaxID=307643 RepID=UPI002AA6F58C|nr:hypothetical protein [Exiguobacterium profundum]
MSIYTFLIVVMLLAMAFEKRFIFRLLLILMAWLLLMDALKNDDTSLLVMVVSMVVSILLIELGFKFIQGEKTK